MTFSCINFECTFCGRHTDIYFENQFDASEVREPAICNKCGTESYCNVGDLGYRSDLSDPDYPPWQAQVIRIDINSICCNACCLEKKEDFFSLKTVAYCENCNKESMCAVGSSKVDQLELSELIHSLK
jgi:hypothetical protein